MSDEKIPRRRFLTALLAGAAGCSTLNKAQREAARIRPFFDHEAVPEEMRTAVDGLEKSLKQAQEIAVEGKQAGREIRALYDEVRAIIEKAPHALHYLRDDVKAAYTQAERQFAGEPKAKLLFTVPLHSSALQGNRAAIQAFEEALGLKLSEYFRRTASPGIRRELDASWGADNDPSVIGSDAWNRGRPPRNR